MIEYSNLKLYIIVHVDKTYEFNTCAKVYICIMIVCYEELQVNELTCSHLLANLLD